MKVSYFLPFFIILFFIFFSCEKSKRNYNNFEITIEKKRVDSINFKARVIIRDKSQIKRKDRIYILIDNEVKLDSKIRNLKEKLLNNK